MRCRVGFVMLMMLTGISSVAAQGIERDRRPDTSGYLLEPVAEESPAPRKKSPPRPTAEDYPDDTPTPRYKSRPISDESAPPAPKSRATKSVPPPDEDERPAPPAAKMSLPKSEKRITDDDLTSAQNSGEGKVRSQDIDLVQYLTESPYKRPAPTSDWDSEDIPPRSTRQSNAWDEKVQGALGSKGDRLFASDHAFDTFASPVSNPFLFEDPRSLTEIKPLFLYQNIPGGTQFLNGGNMGFLGVQGRLAFTDRLSLVVHKFGGQGLQPSGSSIFDGSTGFAEVWLGPKYTFLRDTENGAIMAGGLQFQIPIGDSSVAQNTGSLSLVPYFSYAQNFLRSRSGSFNGIIGTGYSFSTNSQRSDYYYLSAHLDYDVMNKHRFYPLLEMNWLYNTTNGTSRPFFPFEGRDMINFGSSARNTGLLTGAIGGRVKITQAISIGGTFEIPFAGSRGLFDNRWTIDMTWRF